MSTALGGVLAPSVPGARGGARWVQLPPGGTPAPDPVGCAAQHERILSIGTVAKNSALAAGQSHLVAAR